MLLTRRNVPRSPKPQGSARATGGGAPDNVKESGTMETAIMDSKRRFRMAMELLWFASASFGAGLLAAIIAAALVMLLAQPAYALTFREVEFVCPLDGEEFSQRVAASGTSFG